MSLDNICEKLFAMKKDLIQLVPASTVFFLQNHVCASSLSRIYGLVFYFQRSTSSFEHFLPGLYPFPPQSIGPLLVLPRHKKHKKQFTSYCILSFFAVIHIESSYSSSHRHKISTPLTINTTGTKKLLSFVNNEY